MGRQIHTATRTNLLCRVSGIFQNEARGFSKLRCGGGVQMGSPLDSAVHQRRQVVRVELHLGEGNAS